MEKGFYLKEHFRSNAWIYFALIVVFIAGLGWGLISPNGMDTKNSGEMESYVSDLVAALPSADIDNIQEAKAFFSFNGLLMLGLWICGITVIGIPLLIPILFYKGYTLGFSIGLIMKLAPSKGIVLTLLTIIPANLLLIPVLLVGGVLAVRFSLNLLRGKRDDSRSLGKAFGLYCVYFLILGAILAVAALIHGYVGVTLLQLFFNII